MARQDGGHSELGKGAAVVMNLDGVSRSPAAIKKGSDGEHRWLRLFMDESDFQMRPTPT